MNLLALDLDGTTLNSKGELTPAVQSAIQAAVKWPNTIVVFCSGRPLSGVKPFAEKCGMEDNQYHVLSNGALIQAISGEKLSEAALSVADYVTIKTYCDTEDLLLMAVSEKQVYTSNQTINPSGMTFCVLTNNSLVVQPVDQWPEGIHFSKLLICDQPMVIPKKKTALLKRFGNDYACTQGYKDFIELSKKDTSKGSALSKLADYYNITSDNVYVVGDNENDCSSFLQFTHSIAMGNAVGALKKLAASTCPSNDEDGLVDALEQIRLKIRI